ncbi:MAG: hypothetical protein HYV03_08440 [Deltaproteobacteria bacterium]|nr:hypothetical protein [Deltaproteobacteria bacterium]
MRRLKCFAATVSLIVGLSAGRGYAASAQHPVLEKGQSCADCHDDERTRETRPADHTAAWPREHGGWIKRYGFRSGTTCAICHTEAHCTGCHQQEAPLDHTSFWRLKGHGLAVGLDRGRCSTCHRGADFCQRCHSETPPTNHSAVWGSPSNQHCNSCHFPLTAVGAQVCAVCHTGTPSHASAPAQPANALHATGANCRSCHSPLRHPDNGMTCTVCHMR